MRAKAMIVASGAYEQPAVFPQQRPAWNNAGFGAATDYRYAVKPMQRVVLTITVTVTAPPWI